MIPRKLNVVGLAGRQITTVFEPHIVGEVNDSQIKVAKFGSKFDWHSHVDEDEAFLVLQGRICLLYTSDAADE